MVSHLVGFGAGARKAEAEKPTKCGGSPMASLLPQLFGQQLTWALVFQRPHWLVVAPDQVLCQLLIEVFQTAERLPIIEISLVISMTTLHLPVVPWRPRRNQLVLDCQSAQFLIKRAFLCIADILVGKLCTVVRLNRLDFEGKYLHQHPQKLDRVFRRMLLKAVDKPYPGTLIDGCPLVQTLVVSD